jgi:hypothetical protein
MVGCMVAAALCGIKLVGGEVKTAEKKSNPPPQTQKSRPNSGWLGNVGLKL